MQYIGRLMREVAGAALLAQLGQWAEAPAAARSRLHAVERWRERLLSEPAALERLCGERAGVDRARLGELVERVHAERAGARPPRAYRELFRALDALLGQDDEVPRSLA